jgi:beta-lactamase regulating signal transducer with metallopeptidase domain
MLYCLAEGSAIVAVVATVLRLAPERNSRTRFAVWLATLAAVVVLPAIPFGREIGRSGGVSGSSHPLLTLSGTFAEYIILAWAVLAAVGLLRVAAALFQVRRLRRGCFPMSPELLDADLQKLIGEFSSRRPVSILVSSRLQVPTAIGFFRPAIVIPAWLAASADREELKYVLLHELAHLQRWDDWTNLAQKLVKAVLFFHPGVWWIEWKLSLDREMACDDAVLAQAGSPRLYARCLARVAEKSFLRRQIVLAQAAVDRMRQLSLRVARILSADGPRSTRLWKPAIPMVATIALLCAISTSSAPNLVSVNDNPPLSGPTRPIANAGEDQVFQHPAQMLSAKSGAPAASLLHMASFPKATTGSPVPLRKTAQPKRSSLPTARRMQSQHLAVAAAGSLSPAGERQPSRPYFDVEVPTPDSEASSQRYDVVFVMMSGERITTNGSISWQVNMWELRVPAPAERPTKPIPRKT